MKQYKFRIFLFFVVIILFSIAYYNFSGYSKYTVTINDYVFNTDMVTSLEDVTRGLSGRETINDDEAMLFVFAEKKPRYFWMKEMNFDIDLLWIEDNRVVAYEKNMPAPDPDVSLEDLPRYLSPQAVDKVLEIKAGTIDIANIKIGDMVYIDKYY